MRFVGFYVIIYLISLLLCPAALAVSGETNAQLNLQNRSEVAMPVGFYDFCQIHQNFCKNFRADEKHQVIDGKVIFTAEAWQELNSINTFVNKNISPESDIVQYNKKDLWVMNPVTRKGDCEDYVLTKLYALLQKGWPTSALLITLVINAKGQEHAVLLARTSQGDLILDNMSQSVTPWNQRNYIYLKSQSPENVMRWLKLN